jgi:hypothetical protein
VLTSRRAICRMLFAVMVIGALTGATCGVAVAASDGFGYDYAARRFTGLYEDADRNKTNNAGDSTRLVMRWSQSLNLAEPGQSGAGAWVTNMQSGTYVGADGKVYRWTYSVKLVYTGAGSPVAGFFTAQDEQYVDAGGSPTPLFRAPVLPVPAQ